MNPTLRGFLYVVLGVGLIAAGALVPGVGTAAQAMLFAVGGGLIGKEALPQSKAAP